jgi:thiol:disulfide interchange protein
LFVTVELDPGWHIYSMTQKGEGPIPTEIKVSPSPAIKKIGSFLVSPAPEKKMDPGFKIEVENHYDKVIWFAPLELDPNVDVKTLEIKGAIHAQACDQGCRAPEDYPFTAKLATDPAKYAKLIAAAASPESAAKQGFSIESIQITDDATQKEKSLWWYIGLGFLGGLILNIMPCVLPVIGLKILSFMEQAGQSRSRAFVLNLWYSLGLLSVFVLLATLAVAFGFGWGELFRYGGMNLAMTAVVFVMALSFLGTWEVPIPGFIGSGKAESVSHKEGAVGAFAKGVLTTILATPCSAPFLAPAITWAFAQPPGNVFAIFISIGVGMASPYLLIGAWPALIKFLPKPGAWMETFKQVMGFVLLATVIFLLTSTEKERLLPTITFLFGLWASCWWIGKISVLAPTRTKLLHWGEAIAFAVLIWMFAFLWLGAKAEYELPWKPYTTAKFEQLMDEKKTVLVDFTADWCATCKTFEALVLNTEDVYDAVKEHHVVTLKGDWTHREKSKEVNDMLQQLGSKQVPVILIIPDGDPKRMSIFCGSYTKSDILDALKK